MIYGYIRISTDRQTLENQEFEIKNFAQNQNLQIDRWVKETISGTKDFEKRELGRLIRRLKKSDILICSEISRLGRNLLQIMTILNICIQNPGFRIFPFRGNRKKPHQPANQRVAGPPESRRQKAGPQFRFP